MSVKVVSYHIATDGSDPITYAVGGMQSNGWVLVLKTGLSLSDAEAYVKLRTRDRDRKRHKRTNVQASRRSGGNGPVE